MDCASAGAKGIQGVIGYRRHTHKGAHYGKYRFRYDPNCDEYICPEKTTSYLEDHDA